MIYEFLNEAVGRKIYFYEWTLRMLPFTLIFIPFMGFYISHILKPEDVKLPGSKEIYQKELDKMGKMTKGEIYSAAACDNSAFYFSGAKSGSYYFIINCIC